MIRIQKLVAAASAATLVACADSATAPVSNVSAATAVSRSVAPIWTTNFVGTTGEGAQYGIFVPQNWNGDVVYYAHGIVDAALPVGLPTSNVAELRDSLGVMGYAVAYSSFSENGWAVKDGMQKTHQLRGLFAATVGTPTGHSYVIGHSMGGLIALALAEKFPQQYDGALPMCGVVGGAQKQIDYIANVRSTFDVLFHHPLPGDALDMPASLDPVMQVQLPAKNAILGDLGSAVAMSRIDQTPLPWDNFPHLIESIVTALTFDARGADDLLDRTHGHSPFDNSTTQYTIGGHTDGLEGLNAAVKRFEETPDAANYLQKYYQPTGDLKIPVVSIHTALDPVVPIFHEGLYADLAHDAGKSDLLVQRTISRYGHCAFQIGEMTDAFRTLASWVNSGTRPTQ